MDEMKLHFANCTLVPLQSKRSVTLIDRFEKRMFPLFYFYESTGVMSLTALINIIYKTKEAENGKNFENMLRVKYPT